MAESSIPADNVVIWRFLKLNAFLELLTGNFVQVRPDAFDDPMEGAYGFRDARLAPDLLDPFRAVVPQGPNWRDDLVREIRLRALLSCWFEYSRESYAMWRVYGRPGESVAVETTIGQLREILADYDVRIERVRYNKMPVEINDLREPFFYKIPEYAYEREIRSVLVMPHRIGSRLHNTGLLLKQVNGFINRIVIAPGNRPIFKAAIQTTVAGVLNIASLRFNGEIVDSAIDRYMID